jgi:hypothetical protein
MTVYFRRRANRRRRSVVLSYVCIRRELRDAERIRCRRAAKVVTATSLGL